MTKEEVKQVFEPFTSDKSELSRSMNPMSNGVGLSICKQICENLGGDLTVTSQLEVGSTFKFSIKVFRPTDV